eukprot:4679491-Heterocapsa_arctica.AAC.1
MRWLYRAHGTVGGTAPPWLPFFGLMLAYRKANGAAVEAERGSSPSDAHHSFHSTQVRNDLRMVPASHWPMRCT